MIDVAAIGALLAPALPYLLRSADQVATQAATAIGDKGWEYAQRVWDLLAARLGDRPGAQEAAEEVAADPGRRGRAPGARIPRAQAARGATPDSPPRSRR